MADGQPRRRSEEQRQFLNQSQYKEKEEEEMTVYNRFFVSSVRDFKSPAFYRALLGEMIGVFFLVLIGCTSPYKGNAFDHTKVALAFGFSVATMVWILAHISGGHINPAVSTAMLFARRISLAKWGLYIIFQCIGALLASAAQKGFTCEWQQAYLNKTGCELGTTDLNEGVSVGQGFAIELVITFVLVATVFASTDKSRRDLGGSGPLAIGISVAMCHLAFIKITGCSMNPARSFGPAVISGKLENHWLYWVGPCLGGIMAALMYEFIFAGNAGISKMGRWLKSCDYEREPIPDEVYIMRGEPDQTKSVSV